MKSTMRGCGSPSVMAPSLKSGRSFFINGRSRWHSLTNGFKHTQVETKVSFEEPLQIEKIMKVPEVKPAPPPQHLP